MVNGPVMSMLGQREPDKYGSFSLADIEKRLQTDFPEKHFVFFQSDIEGEIISFLLSNNNISAVIINPAGYTTTSVAIRDALSAIAKPSVEVHITNIHAREEFRKNSLIAPVCIGQIAGLGIYSYILAARFLIDYLKTNEQKG